MSARPANDGALLSGELRIAGRLDARFFALLQALHDTGSINRAARTAGLSYKGAWLLLETAGLPGAYALYTAAALLSLVFVVRLVPETKGKALEEM